VGPGPDIRINQVWEFDPATNNWTRKADVPAPGPGTAYGSAVEFGGKIYVFGGVMGPPDPITVLRTLWIYDVAANTWSRGRDLPSDNFGIAVAKVGSKIILAYGSGFALQTWEYDPATDNYTRKADPPSIPAPFRVHGAAIGNEMHAFAGGFGGTAHVIYNAATNSWRTAPLIPFGVTDPAVSVINGKFYVVGGRPIPRTQIFDPATNTWSQGPTVAGLPNGVDNTGGDVISSKFYLVGGFDGANGINAHRVFTVCGAGAAQQIPYVADGDGTVPGIPNESTALVLSNDLASSSITATVFFYRTDGTLDSSRAFTLASKETQVLNDIIRRVRGTSGVQNVEGSLLVLASQSLDAIALVNSNATNDLSVVDGQLLTGISNGFVPVIQWNSPYRTQVVLDNASSAVANAQLLAYPPGGGDAPQASTSVTVPPRGILDFPNIVTALGLPVGYSGQLTWNSTGPLFVFARQLTLDGGFSGAEPVHKLTDGSSTQVIGYVEDTDDFSTSLLLNNPGGFTADVTVLFFDVGDPAGGTAGDVSSRDLQVHVNSATSISDIVRWVLRSSSATPTGKRGFLVITSPQTVTAQVSLVNRATADPANLDSGGAASNGFTSFILAGATRVAITNPGTTLANVDLAAFNPDGSPAGAPTRIQVVGRGQFFTEDIAPFLTLPTGFVGSMTVRSDAPVIVLNQERTPDNRGAIVPVHPR
jgi:N-acetylneuraminic acid mutarotase